MPHVLHLLKDPANTVALEVIRLQAAEPDTRLSIVLVHDARRLAEPLPGEVYRLDDRHPEAPARAGGRPISTAELLDLIFAVDSVVSW